MIEIQTKIHDQFSIEFKVGFSGRDNDKVEHFDVNSWIFLPNGLYINKDTYSKERFYTDMKSNIRLLTPSFTLKQMVEGANAPLQQVTRSINNSHEFNFQLKMFGSIFKSSIRDESNEIIKRTNNDGLEARCKAYIADLRYVLQSYRNIRDIIDTTNEDALKRFAFTDEFISHQVEIMTVKVIKSLQNQEGTDDYLKALTALLKEETDYKIKKNYSHVKLDDNINNRRLVWRHSQLKKYIESVLFLESSTTQDGQAVKQISFSLAAGLAMMVYLLVTTLFQKYLGNYPNLIFFILVIFYILKDRIKELTRWMFAYQLKDKYYDNKTVISIKDNKVGILKEGMDFITDDKVPEEVLKLRARTKLEAYNKLLDERIILYRKRVEIDNETLKNQYTYDFRGINAITRYHLSYISKKMDNPVTHIEYLDENNQMLNINTDRIYMLHFVMQFKWEDQMEYKVLHVTMNRNGILDIS